MLAPRFPRSACSPAKNPRQATESLPSGPSPQPCVRKRASTLTLARAAWRRAGDLSGLESQGEARTRAHVASRAVALLSLKGRGMETQDVLERSHQPPSRGSPAEWRRSGCPRCARRLCRDPSPRAGRTAGRGLLHGAWRAARSPWELVFPGGHVTGLAVLGPRLGGGSGEQEAGGGRLACCVLRSCARAFLGGGGVRGRRRRGHRSAFSFSQC
ncbi:uncharacterized protein LOC131481572 [Ochotona princeps]|uniref:uncharacterized protein LOC131481572 n=1 Tax=Ochotona princeps TaxID=9978 RepID=UPI0027154A27|nr:uncharacterized protein LOC131481572 [Ochotona princeps]XP_058526780.1 uncharacterized protein LOC131481572 [Ochotona princeps]